MRLHCQRIFCEPNKVEFLHTEKPKFETVFLIIPDRLLAPIVDEFLLGLLCPEHRLVVAQ